jgi:hypothetical protein
MTMAAEHVADRRQHSAAAVAADTGTGGSGESPGELTRSHPAGQLLFEYPARDFRTWHATVLAAVGLAVSGQADSEAARERAVARVVQEVAGYLGNTPAVARASYIDPPGHPPLRERPNDRGRPGRPRQGQRLWRPGHQGPRSRCRA